VPKSLTANCVTDELIYAALDTYVKQDIFINSNMSDNKTSREGYIDQYQEKLGITQEQYNANKSRMLRSIKNNGGFYIGKYETGYELSAGGTSRNYSDEDIHTEHPINETPVIKENAYPYNYVTVGQAQTLSGNLKTDINTTTSLMYGIQWDLVLKYLKVKGNLETEQIVVDSKNLGNYCNSSFRINRGKYLKYNDYTTWYEYTNPMENIVNVQDRVSTKLITTSQNSILLTCGAADLNGRLNIYDLAGNVWEWTLEKKLNEEQLSFVNRGGAFDNAGNASQLSIRNNDYNYSSTQYNCGFRTTMY